MSIEPIHALVVPTTLEYRLHSKYWSRRRRKPHDFTIEIVIDIDFDFFDYLTCPASQLITKVFKDRYTITLTYKGIPVTLEVYNVDVVDFLRGRVEEQGRYYSIRYISRMLKDDKTRMIETLRRELHITKALATGIVNEALNYLINGARSTYGIFTVDRAQFVSIQGVYQRVKPPIELNYPEEYNGFLSMILLAIDELVADWFAEYLQWDYPIAGELVELDGGIALKQECHHVISVENVADKSVLQSSIRVSNVEYRRSNAYDVEPVDIVQWSTSLRQFLEDNIDDITNAIWSAYERYILPLLRFEREEEVV